MKKVEIIIRTINENTSPTEKIVAEFTASDNKIEIEQNVLSYPGLEIHLEHRIVFKKGQEIHLSRYEYGILSFMAQHPGQLFTKEQIFAAVWHKDSDSYLSAVTNTISRIRQKVEDDREHPRYIKTLCWLQNHKKQKPSRKIFARFFRCGFCRFVLKEMTSLHKW